MTKRTGGVCALCIFSLSLFLLFLLLLYAVLYDVLKRFRFRGLFSFAFWLLCSIITFFHQSFYANLYVYTSSCYTYIYLHTVGRSVFQPVDALNFGLENLYSKHLSCSHKSIILMGCSHVLAENQNDFVIDFRYKLESWKYRILLNGNMSEKFYVSVFSDSVVKAAAGWIEIREGRRFRTEIWEI